MKTENWLSAGQHQLELAGVGTARLDALVLLEDVTGINRARLLAEPELELTAAQEAKLKKLLTRRAAHEPLAYIRGKTEFYGREFVITPAVLEPRPESETMIDCLKELARSGVFDQRASRKICLADVGAGSGALGITAKIELSTKFSVVADLLEIDPQAAEVAKMNVDKYTMDVSVILSDLLDSSKREYDVLLCNLPYVPDDHTINQAAMQEPSIAIFGGPDGLDLYRRLFNQVAKLSKPPLYLLTEALPPQHPPLEHIAAEHHYHPVKTEDFIQVFTYTSSK